MKEIKDELNKWRTILLSQIERLNIVKMSSQLKIPGNYFVYID